MTLVGDVLYGADAAVAQWVAARIPSYRPEPDARALGIQRRGRMVAGVVYERWNGVHCETSIAVDAPGRWATRSALFAIFHYPFVQMDCHAISACVPISNLPSLNLCTKLGFEPEAIIRFAAHDGGDLVVLKQFRDQCRWLDHGERRRRTEAARPAGNCGGGGAI